MPIVEVELVGEAAAPAEAAALSRRLADAAGAALGSRPGATWVKLRFLPAAQYAESGGQVEGALPAFVKVLHRQPPAGEALEAEVARLTGALAQALGRPADRVHLEYQPAGAGRQAFGGKLVR